MKCPFVRRYCSEQGDPRPLLPSARLRIVFKCREDRQLGEGPRQTRRRLESPSSHVDESLKAAS